MHHLNMHTSIIPVAILFTSFPWTKLPKVLQGYLVTRLQTETDQFQLWLQLCCQY